MDSIVLRVSELKKVAVTIAKDHMSYVQLMLLDGDVDNAIPPSVSFTAFRADLTFELVEYDELDGVPEADAGFNLM